MKRMACLCMPALLVLAGAARAQERTVVIEAGRYNSARQAQAAWRPIPGTGPVGVAADRTLEFPCRFKTSTDWRAGWDRKGKWNLSGCRTIEVDTHADRAARMRIYLQSGAGWYGASFEAPAGVGRAEIPCKRFRIEDKPTGWDKVTTVRLAVMRSGAKDLSVRIKGVRAIIARAKVAIYRNNAGLKRENAISQFVGQMADRLDRIGVDYTILDDQAVAGGKLRGYKLAVLPLNPILPKPAGEAIRAFVAAGGKLIVCYHLPSPLDELLGLNKGDSMHRGPDGALNAFDWPMGPAGKPVRIVQQSWIAHRVTPRPGAEVKACWINAKGETSKAPAVAGNANGVFIGHVLTPADVPAKDRFVFDLVGRLWPGAVRVAYARQWRQLGRVAGFRDRAELSAAVRKATNKPEAQKLLVDADKLARAAESAAAKGEHRLAIDALAGAQQAYMKAYATSLSSKPGEMRAVWCHAPEGVKGRTWDAAMKRLADCGFNMVIPNMLWGGGAAYKSEVQPSIASVAEHGDMLAKCVAAGKKYGVEVHVWKVNWRLWRGTPKPWRQKMRDAGRLQVDAKGKPLDWLCPSHPANQKLELDAMVEVARNYDVAGIHFDYIRYPGKQGCYCDGCRKRFEQQAGVCVAHWPADVVKGPLVEKFTQFRRDHITRLVAAVSREARKVKPGVKISAAVFWNWPNARNTVAQDWPVWIEKGYLDFVCPMTYTPSVPGFDGRVQSVKKWVGGRIPLLPGIGATIGQTPDVTLRQVLVTRKHNTAGFVLFNYDAVLADDYLPLMALGATKR